MGGLTVAFYPPQNPPAEVGSVGPDGTYTTAGQGFSATQQIQDYRPAAVGDVVAVRVGRMRAIIGQGAFYSAKTTYPE